MAYPTTRRDRYIRRRHKFLKKHETLYNNWGNVPAHPASPGHAAHGRRTKWIRSFKGKLKPLSEQLKHNRHNPIIFDAPLFYIFGPAGQGYHHPPHATRVFPWPGISHQHFEQIGFQMRTVEKLGPKQGKRNAAQRMSLGAEGYYATWGVWPHWDPDLRTPFQHDDDFVPRTPYGVFLNNQR